MSAEFSLKQLRTFRQSLRDIVPILDMGATSDYGRLSAWFEEARSWKDKEGRRRLAWLRKADPDHPLLGTVGLLGPMQMGLRELAHTSLLAWFLDPAQDHGFGASLLEALLRHLVGGKVRRTDRVQVTAESHLGPDNGRVDVHITGRWRNATTNAHWLLLIEAKIRAPEDAKQQKRYDNYARHWQNQHVGGQVFKVYLAPVASQNKAGEKGAQHPGDWIRLDYEDMVDLFWRAGRTQRDCTSYALLRYYLTGVLKDIMDWPIPLAADRTPYEAIDLLPKAAPRVASEFA
ncbi:MAG: PD-(D/E)XK nuclease family protein [Acidiferrobacter sp.]